MIRLNTQKMKKRLRYTLELARKYEVEPEVAVEDAKLHEIRKEA